MPIDPDGESSVNPWNSLNPGNFIELWELGRSIHPSPPNDCTLPRHAAVTTPSSYAQLSNNTAMRDRQYEAAINYCQ